MGNKPDPTMDCPQDFRCPISMEIMKDPVTISTGVTYEKKNIEKWLFTYKKKTCPATMQSIGADHFGIILTPNRTLKRLILAWQDGNSHSHSSSPPPPPPSTKHRELVLLLNTIESTPFKVRSLKKLKSIVEESDDEIELGFKASGGVEVLVRIMVQILGETSDLVACEEALGVLNRLGLVDQTIQLLLKPEPIKAMAIALQRGSAEGRFYAISMFHKINSSRANYDWISLLTSDQGIDSFIKSILELVSDEICTKASSCALKVLIEMISACSSTKRIRLKAIEAGAVCVLIELLPESNRSKSEKIMHLIKLLCECADGRLAFAQHGLGIAAVTKKMLPVPDVATKIGVKILWLICNSHPSERVLEEMLVLGAVKKLVALLHVDGRSSSSTKEKVMKIFKLHGNSWRRYPCLPSDLRDYLGFN